MAVMLFHAFRLLRFFSWVLGLAFLLFAGIEPALAGPASGSYLPGQLLVKLKPAPPGRALAVDPGSSSRASSAICMDYTTASTATGFPPMAASSITFHFSEQQFH